MKKQTIKKNCLIAALLAASGVCVAYPVAGVNPDQRPADAPVIGSFEKNGAWYANALSGVQRPYPKSLRFLEDQGAWYTPFTRPGMDGRYDIRHWHSGG